MRISTQVYVLVEGDRKVMEYTDPAGLRRVLTVDIDLDQCGVCGALLPPGNLNGRHEDWHRSALVPKED